MKLRPSFLIQLAVVAGGFLPAVLSAQNLVSQNPGTMTSALTTTVTSQTTSGGVTTTTYATNQYMNDPTSGSPAASAVGIANTAYTNYSGTAVAGTTITSTAGQASVTFSGVTYNSGVGTVYSNAGFWIDSGALNSAAGTPTAATAGVAFRFSSDDTYNAASTAVSYFVGVDLVGRGDLGANPATNTVGTATIDFYIGLQFSSNSPRLFIAGAPTTVSGIADNVNDSPNQLYVGNVTGSTGVGANQYLTNAGGIQTAAVNIATNTQATTLDGSNYVYRDTRNSTNDYVTFGALYSQINSALAAIYGSTNGTPNVQWEQGDVVRFVPFTINSTSFTSGLAGTGDLYGGTVNFGISIPFGTNATAAITNAYTTGVNFELTHAGTDGLGLNPVPEPATWIGTGTLLAAGLGGLYWRRRQRTVLHHG